ncbi:hypothetical protein SKC37_09195 [Aquirufa sp. HETE-83D]|uniref:Lipoprotein n=1 Tax=Aquirufa esocilacus TaxID=3096513 RepID=A0ABW6DMS3_9BACT
MKKIVTILVACLFILTSCSKSDTPSVSVKEATEIFKNLKQVQPINVAIASIDDVEKIVCLAKKSGPESDPYSDKYIIYLLTKFADTWRVESEKEIISLEFEMISFEKNFEIIELDNKAYLYFIYSTGPVGNAISYVDYNFSLVSLKDLTISELVYQELGDESDFINIEDFKDKPTVLKYLEERAAKSEFIKKPSGVELDVNNPVNFEKKWKIDNANISTVWEGNTAINNNIKVTYYPENIFPDEKNSSFSKIENETYLIISMFRNDVLGYDKVKKKYFPIWVESCSHGCNKEIEFIDNNKLKITYSESQNETIIVDLKTMDFEINK